MVALYGDARDYEWISVTVCCSYLVRDVVSALSIVFYQAFWHVEEFYGIVEGGEVEAVETFCLVRIKTP